ncbi:MAG: hypothetical protein ACK45R_03150 [Candidatus Kapaibacterium sp.]|jgi:hypothetical protein
MTHDDIMQWCANAAPTHQVFDFPEELFHSLNTETALEISRIYGARHLMVLPRREQEFFAWVKEHDADVWTDLWSGTEEAPYVVSLAFLPALLDPSRGFPICDLENVENYFFVPGLVQGENAQDFVEAVRERFLAKDKLTVEQVLALECSLSPVDIWHFAWHHGIALSRAKQAVQQLVEEKILLHLRTSAELADYIE